MAIIEINRNPSATELRLFGVGLAAFAALAGAVLWWRTSGLLLPALVWGVGGAVALVHLAVPQWRRAIYLGWLHAAYPIGWVVSHVVLAAVFYLLVTPIGLIMRALGRDPLNRRFDAAARSYWVPHDPGRDIKRYLRQF